MADITVLRVEISGTANGKEGSLESGNKSNAAGGSLAAGGLGGKLALSSEKERTLKGDDILKNIYPKTKKTSEQLKTEKDMKEMFGYDAPKRMDMVPTKRSIPKPTSKQVATGITSTLAVGTQAFSMYSNYQKAGYEMSGATHAAAMQGRTAQGMSTASQVAIGFVINPAAGAAMIAMKAYQLAQTNRKEIFDIKKSQMTSQLLQRNLVKTVAERRF